MSIKLAGGPTCARALPCVEPAGCTYTHARAMQFLYGRTDVRTDVRTHHVTTKFSRLHGLPYFLRYGAPLRGPSAREGAPLLTSVEKSLSKSEYNSVESGRMLVVRAIVMKPYNIKEPKPKSSLRVLSHLRGNKIPPLSLS